MTKPKVPIKATALMIIPARRCTSKILSSLRKALIKAFRKDDNILLVQRRAGIIIGAVALVGTLGLVMIKPVFA